MGVIAGIDEAGFGPVIGPLVVSATAVQLPDDAMDADIWRLLGATVGRKPSRRAGSLAIGDSKKLYSRQRPNALQHLERGVLASLAAQGARVGSLRELLRIVSPAAEGAMAHYPWYAEADLPLPQCISATDVAFAGNALGSAMHKAGVRPAGIRSEIVFAGEFNRIARATHNKSVLLFGVNSRLLIHLCKDAPPGPLRIYADRHGGRIHYRAPLQQAFAGCGLKVLDETPDWSGYRITGRRRQVELYFGVEFDRCHLAVALASMVSKYLRELFMMLLNRFWARRVDNLKPTAGYYTDGKRFLADIAPAIEAASLGPDLLRRCR